METAINNEKYYNVKQASERFGLSYQTIYSACKHKRLDCRELNGTYMIAETAMLDYINNRKARIIVPTYSQLTVDDLAEEILKRINDAYEKGYEAEKKDAKQTLSEALKGLK